MGILDYIKDLGITAIERTFDNLQGDLEYRAQMVIRKASNYFIRELTSLLLIAISIMFFALASVFFLIEYVYLSKTLSFLILGIIFILIGIVFKIKWKEHYGTNKNKKSNKCC